MINVQLPDKKITLQFPNDMSEVQIKDVINKKFYPEKYIPPPVAKTSEVQHLKGVDVRGISYPSLKKQARIEEPMPTRKAVQTLTAITTGAMAWIPSKVAGLTAALTAGGDKASVEFGKRIEEKVGGLLSYAPKDPEAQETVQIIGHVIDTFLYPAKVVGETVEWGLTKDPILKAVGMKNIGHWLGYLAEFGTEFAEFKGLHIAGKKVGAKLTPKEKAQVIVEKIKAKEPPPVIPEAKPPVAEKPVTKPPEPTPAEVAKPEVETPIRVYRATKEPFKPELMGEAVYVTSSEQVAKYFLTGERKIEVLLLDEKAKMLNYEDIPKNLRNIKDWDKYSSSVAKYTKEQGYDAVYSTPDPTGTGKFQTEITIVNPKVIKSFEAPPVAVKGVAKPEAPPVKAPLEKEAWQMTKDEYVDRAFTETGFDPNVTKTIQEKGGKLTQTDFNTLKVIAEANYKRLQRGEEEFKLATEEGRIAGEPQREIQKGIFEKESFMEKMTEKEVKEKIPITEKEFNLETDTLSTWVMKKGGINYQQEHWKGELDHLREAGKGRFIVNKSGKGYSLDRLAEMAREDGFLREGEGKVELLTLLERDLTSTTTGKKVYSIYKEDYFPEMDRSIELYAGIPVHKILPEKWQTKWQEFWRPFSTVPESKELLKARAKQFGGIDRAEDFIKNVYKKLKPFDSEIQKDIFRFLDGKLDITDLPIESQFIAKSIQQRTITIGKMLVKRGILKPEQFEAHKGQYIHYMYARHILGDEGTIGINPTGKLNLSYTKSRNPNLTPEQRQALGLVEDASIAVPTGMGKALVDIAKYDYLEAIANNPNWTWQPSIIRIDKQKFTIGKLVKEVEAYEKMIKEIPDSPQIKTRYTELKTALEKAKIETGNIPEGFAQLPTTKTYGSLAGAYVRKPIADDLVPLFNSFTVANQGKLLKTLMDIETRGMAIFKAAHVATNLPTASRNIVSNILQNNMRGRALAYIPNDIRIALKSMLDKDKYYVESKKYGNFRTSWSVTEVNDILNQFIKVEGGNMAQLLNAIKGVAKYYGKIDDIAKHTIFVELRKKGIDAGEAALEAQKWGMDYSLASRSVKGLRRHIVPFITYQYKIAPLIYESLTKRPWIIGKFAIGIPLLMKLLSGELHDISEEDWKRLERNLPPYIKKNKTYAVVPWKSPEGYWQWVNLEYYFPWGNWMSVFKDLKKGDFTELNRDSGIGNPFLDIYTAFKGLSFGEPPKDPYTGIPFYNRLDSPQTKAFKTIEFIYNKWAPSMLTEYGALGYTTKIGEKDKWGKTITPSQAIGRWFGFNIVVVSPKQVRATKKGMIGDLEEEYYKIVRDPQKSSKEKKKARKRLIERRKQIIRGEYE